MDEESKNVLLQIFAVLGFSEEENKKALLDFQKKIASELLRSVQGELPRKYREFIAKEGPAVTDASHPMVVEIRNALRSMHGDEEYRAMGKAILKQLLPGYADYMAKGLSEEKSALLRKLLKDFFG